MDKNQQNKTDARSVHSRLLLKIGFSALVVATLTFYGLNWYSHARFVEETDDAYVGADITVIAPKVPGLIAKVAVADNQFVHAGDLLVKIDDRDYKAALHNALASVAAQEAAIGNIAAQRGLQEAVIAQQQAMLDAAQADFIRAQKDEKRNHSLAHTDAVSAQTLEHVETDLQTAQASLTQAQAALAAAQQKLAVLDAQEKEAQARLQQAQAQKEQAEIDLSQTNILSPIDGYIGNRNARTDAYAATGAQLLAVVPAQGLWVDANFKENQLQNIRPGLPAHITADALPGQELTGRIESLSPATGAKFSILPPENATGNFTKIVQRVPVRILLTGKKDQLGLLRPGLSVSVRVDGTEAVLPSSTQAPVKLSEVP